MKLNPRSVFAALAAVCLVGSLAACASGPSAGVDAAADAAQGAIKAIEDAVAGPNDEGNDEGNDDRAFGASDDMVIQAIEGALSSKNASASWDGSVLKVKMDGSAESLTASIPCLAVEALLADGESAVLVFSDGELICADRPQLSNQ